MTDVDLGLGNCNFILYRSCCGIEPWNGAIAAALHHPYYHYTVTAIREAVQCECSMMISETE